MICQAKAVVVVAVVVAVVVVVVVVVHFKQNILCATSFMRQGQLDLSVRCCSIWIPIT